MSEAMQKKRVLLIDDEDMVSRLLKLNLEQAGSYEVKIENQAARSLAAVRQFKPDTILLDIVMPERNGMEVAQDIWSEDGLKHIPIIFFSATIAKRGVRSLGGAPTLPKPSSVKDIVKCIEHNLIRHPMPDTGGLDNADFGG